ncbi:kinase-like domain-containing protein [Glomus cerebriforme]|uniref:Kinase-like domain-containing protein n=1 Tax=Glomus cerebriforme TaxID=658196 RepID=A0A397SPP3_9GLOM|nr:kinase-like domain-containing protein [Glomus cerebriforme]
MDQLTNYKHKSDFLLSTDTSLNQHQPTQDTVKPKRKPKKCNECNKKRIICDESNQICRNCYGTKLIYKPSGNKVIDDFIRYTLFNNTKFIGKMEFVPYDRFTDIKFIAEGGFSKIYKATWIDGPIRSWDKEKQSYSRRQNYQVVLKKLNNSKNITSKELNELKIFYELSRYSFFTYIFISKYFGITQDPITQDIIIIIPYYNSGDLTNYITNDFYSISWKTKFDKLKDIIIGLSDIHKVNIIHRDFHSGNIFFHDYSKSSSIITIGDLGISKSATESTDDNNENYGIIPYMAPEIFQGQKYTKASDIYSFGMIMWEFMTGRRPFWDRNHDTDLIIEICDGERPPIVTNAPEGYIELMKECWHSDPNKRPNASVIRDKFRKMWNEAKQIPTEIIASADIGPVTTNNPSAIYKSRPLSGMIRSAMSTRSLRSQSITSDDLSYHYQKRNISFNVKEKRKLEDNKIENSFNEGKSIKKIKFGENENNNDYVTKEFGFDIDINSK